MTEGGGFKIHNVKIILIFASNMEILNQNEFLYYRNS